MTFSGTTDNTTDLAIDSTAGTVTVGATTANAFAATTTYIDNQSSQYVNATNNTFGGLTPSAGGLADDYIIQNGIIDALDNESYGLVQIVAGNVYITQLNETNYPGSFLNNVPDSIQRGIDAAEANSLGTVNVQAGTYQANSVGSPGGLFVDATAPLSILGPNSGVNPNTGSPNAPAIVVPSATGTDPSADFFVQVFYVMSSDVTIEGFTINGYNSALPDSGIDVGGVDVNAGEGIASYQGVGGITVENNVIENTSYSGVDFYNAVNPAATSDNVISDNKISNVGYDGYLGTPANPSAAGIGVILYNNFYAQVNDNVISSVLVGVQTGNFSNANSDLSFSPSISGNTITSAFQGIFYNLSYTDASAFTISSNTINEADESVQSSCLARSGTASRSRLKGESQA